MSAARWALLWMGVAGPASVWFCRSLSAAMAARDADVYADEFDPSADEWRFRGRPPRPPHPPRSR